MGAMKSSTDRLSQTQESLPAIAVG